MSSIWRLPRRRLMTVAAMASTAIAVSWSSTKQPSAAAACVTDTPGGLDSKVGNTPLVYLKTLSAATGCHIYAKCEFMNPTGSIKDRAAVSILNRAEATGALKPGGTIVEGTGGNTGISLAQLGRARGYKVVLTMAENVAKEKVDYMRLLGAEVHVQPMVPFGNPKHYFQLAENIALENGGLFTNQFENKANYMAHFSGTGPEIYRQTNQSVDIFVSASGTGGTLGGVSSFLKGVNPEIQCILADPPGSSLLNYVHTSSLAPSEGSSMAEGIGSGRITANFAMAKIDGAVPISDEELVGMAYYLLKYEGLYVGPSAALNVAAAVKVASQRGNKNTGKTVVTILCDGGDRYASKMYNRQWLEKQQLAVASQEGGNGTISFLRMDQKAS